MTHVYDKFCISRIFKLHIVIVNISVIIAGLMFWINSKCGGAGFSGGQAVSGRGQALFLVNPLIFLPGDVYHFIIPASIQSYSILLGRQLGIVLKTD